MLLNLRIKYRKKILNKYAKKYGLNHKKTQEQSFKLDKLINEYYEKGNENG